MQGVIYKYVERANTDVAMKDEMKKRGEDEAIRDERVNSLMRRIRELEQEQKEAERKERKESKYQSKVYNRNLEIKMEYINSMLIRQAISLYNNIKPYLYQSMSLTEMYQHLDNVRLFEDFDIKAEKTLLFRLPTFHLQGIGQKIHYFYVVYRDCVSTNQVNALAKLLRSHAQYDAMKRKYRIDAVTIAVIANRAEEGEKFIAGDCRSAITLIGFNNADLLNRLCTIMASFYASKLAGIYQGDQTRYKSKQGLRMYFLKRSLALLSNLIKSGTLELPLAGPRSSLSLSMHVERITLRLLYILEAFKSVFQSTATVIADTLDEMKGQIMKRVEKMVQAKLKIYRDIARYVTRKPLKAVPLRRMTVADLFYEAIYNICVIEPFKKK